MGFFNRKKKERKEEAEEDLPDLKFPDFTKCEDLNEDAPESSDGDLPNYEPQIEEVEKIKEAVSAQRGNESVSMPRTHKRLKKGYDINEEYFPKIEQPTDHFTEHQTKYLKKESKQLFVKIEDYKNALNLVSMIRSRLANAEDLLKRLNSLKDEEETKLKEWQDDVDEIKSKLMEIDHLLFE